MTKVSVIVPVYNVEMYLEQCLYSLVRQSLEQIEIICVDDGSTDASAEILANFAKNYANVKVITQKNSGQSAARNVGISLAKGEYIGFLDSDDWADLKMFEKLYENAKKFDTDMTICGINTFNEKTEITTTEDPYLSLKCFKTEHFNKSFTYKDCTDFIFRICVTPWNKIYKRDWLLKGDIKFVEGIFFEDNVFFINAFINASKVSLLDEALAFYRKISKNSTTSAANDAKKLDFFVVFDEIEKVLRKNNLFEQLETYFLQHKENTLIYWFNKLNDSSVKKIYNDKFFELYNEIL